MSKSTTIPILHVPFRHRQDGSTHYVGCDLLRTEERGNTKDAALAKMAKSLDLLVQISLARDTLPELMRKLEAATPKRRTLSLTTTDPGGFKVDPDLQELLLPMMGDAMGVAAKFDRERGGPSMSVPD
jgi:hypothetical protein